MREYRFDFYNSTNLKSYDLNESMRYQLGTLDSLDAFTRRHSENVANLTCRLCEKLHMKTYFTIYCTMCAYLHDVGKQFIPPSILQKKGRLTDEEYEIMKTHTTIGYKICMNDLKLRPYANGALYHHEGLDGSGYPNGLTRKKIPLEGKIIRVADEFDAIVSKRQYKSHVGISDTLRILLDESTSKKVGKGNALKALKEEADPKAPKIDPKIFRALVKVVIDDTEYEQYCLTDYIKYLKENISRLEQVKIYRDKHEKAQKDSEKEFFKQGVLMMLDPGETFDNCLQVLQEYKDALLVRQAELDKLHKELKAIKKMK